MSQCHSQGQGQGVVGVASLVRVDTGQGGQGGCRGVVFYKYGFLEVSGEAWAVVL